MGKVAEKLLGDLGPTPDRSKASAGRPKPNADRSKFARCRVTNENKLMVEGDGRSAWARRLRDIISLHLADLGGADHASEAEKSLVRRAGVLTVELERLEHKFAESGIATAKDLDLYQRCSGNLRRLFEATGIRRRPRDITPTLSEYLESKSREAAEAELVTDEEKE